MHKPLLGTGAGLIGASLLLALILPSVDPLSAGRHVTLLAVFAWAQHAALVVGAALLAAGLVVVRLAPPPSQQRDPRDPASDWFA